MAGMTTDYVSACPLDLLPLFGFQDHLSMSASSYDVRASWPAPIQERLGEMEDMHRRSPHDRFVKCPKLDEYWLK